MANAGGIMNWELSQDTTGATSLVSAIYTTATGGTGDRRRPARSAHRPITGIGRQVRRRGRASSTANGTAVQLYTCNGTNAQTWTVGRDGTLRALGKCMDVTSAGTANGTKIQLWDCNGTGAQVWQAQSNGTLRNPRSGRCLDVTGNSLRRRHPAADLGLLRQRQPALGPARNSRVGGRPVSSGRPSTAQQVDRQGRGAVDQDAGAPDQLGRGHGQAHAGNAASRSGTRSAPPAGPGARPGSSGCRGRTPGAGCRGGPGRAGPGPGSAPGHGPRWAVRSRRRRPPGW